MTTISSRQHALGLFRSQLRAAFQPFVKYGQDIYISQAVEHVVKAALVLHTRLAPPAHIPDSAHPEPALMQTCEECGAQAMTFAEGCFTCLSCGFSKCG